MDERTTGENLNEWRISPKPTKWALGVVVWIGERTVWVIDNDQSSQNHNNDKNNKNLIQYDFPFVSGVSHLRTTGQGYIQEQLWDTAVKARIYCIRHGMSVQEKEGKKLQTADTPLCEDAKKQYKENAEKLKRFWVKSENTYLLYCEETDDEKIVVRIAESAGLIAEGIWIPPERIIKTMSWLDTTDKDDDVVNRRISITKSISIDFAVQLLAKIWGNTVWDINIICIIHKSNIEGIQEGIFQNKEDRESHLPKMDEIETGEITCIDVDRAWRPLNYKRRLDILRFDEGNYESILNVLKWEEELQNIFHLFKTWKIQIWELQNYVNGYFQWNPECFSRFLNDKNSSRDMRVFCLANLIKSKKPKDKESIQTYIHQFRSLKSSLPLEILRIFIKDLEISEISKEAFLVSLFYANSAQKSEIYTLCKDNPIKDILTKIENIIPILKKSNERSLSIFTNSLDTIIQKQEWLISRWLFTFQRKSEKELEKLREEKQWRLSKKDEYNKISIKMESILSSDSFVHVLFGNVGNGKSTELAKMKFEIDNNPNYISLFYTAKTHNRVNITEEIRGNIDSLQTYFPEKKIVVFFDGIDELNRNIREDILAGLKELHSIWVKIILGSRPLWFDKYENVDIQTVHFGKIEINEREKFLRSRLENLGIWAEMMEKKLQEIEVFLEKPTLSEDIKETPLILYFLTELCVNGELGTIKNRTDLYERMIEKILTKHQGRKTSEDEESNPPLGKLHLKSLKQTLSFCAYLMHKKRDKERKDETVLKREDVKIYLKKFIMLNTEIEPDEEELEKLVDKIFLLYQLEWGEYQFILKSFEEYFLARYIWTQSEMSTDKNNPEATEWESIIYQMRDGNFEKWNNWRNFRPVVLFYSEMLANTWDIYGLERLLGEEGLLKNDDMFGEGFFIGLEILYKLPEELRISDIYNKYEQLVKNWSIEDTIKKIDLIKRFSGTIGYKDSIITDKVIELISKLWIEKTHDLFKGIASPKIINDCICQLYISSMNEDSIWLMRICIFLIESWTNDGILAAIDWTRIMVEKKMYWESCETYKSLISSWKKDGILAAIDWIRILVKKFTSYGISEIYGSLLASWEKDSITAAIEGAHIMVGKEEYIYSSNVHRYLAISWDKVAITAAIAWTQMHIKKNMGHMNWKVYEALAISWDRAAIITAIEWAQVLIELEQYTSAWNVYLALLQSWDKNAIQAAIEWARIMLEKKMYRESWKIYKYLLEYWIETGIAIAIELSSFKKGNKKNDIFFFLYKSLLKTGNKKAMQVVIEWAQELSERELYYEVYGIYKALARSWKKKAIQAAIEWAQELTERELYSEVSGIYKALARSWKKKAIQAAIEWAQELTERELYSEVSGIYKTLARSWKKKAIQAAIEWAKILTEKGQINMARIIYEALVQYWDKEAIQLIVKLALVYIEKREYIWAEFIFATLLETWIEEIVQVAIEWVKLIEENWIHDNSWMIYYLLLKSWKEEGIRIAIEWLLILEKRGENKKINWLCYYYLIKSWKEEGIRIAIRWFQNLENMNDFGYARTICHSLASSWNKEWIQWAILYTQRIMEEFHDYFEVWQSYRYLLNTWSKEAIVAVLDWTQIFINKWEYFQAWKNYAEIYSISKRII